MKTTLTLTLLFLGVGMIIAQWSQDPNVNTVLEKPGDQRAPLITSDGKGGAIVTWNEDGGVFVNWIDKYGFLRWDKSGVRITPIGRIGGVTNIISDGRGGAVIVWEDLTKARQVGDEVIRIIENEIFAQRVDSLGQLAWNPSGVAVRTKIDSTTVSDFALVTSDYEEFIVVWTDDRRHPYPKSIPLDFYAQKINSKGDCLWQFNGKLITINSSLYNVRRRVVTDGAGGFILARFDNDPNAQQATVVERISSDGQLLWQPGGVPTRTGGAFEIDSDGQGGIIIAGIYFPGGGFIGQVRAQRINNKGELLWGDSAKVIAEPVDLDTTPRIINDKNSGAFIYWDAKNNLGERKGFLQHINYSGIILWSPITVRFNVTSTIHPIFISDQINGWILLAIDFFGTPEGQFWAVRGDFQGNFVWGDKGILFRRRPFNDWPFYFDAIAEGSGGFIAVWDQVNMTTSWDVVLQQVNSRGELGEVITSIEFLPISIELKEHLLFQNYPNPFNIETKIHFLLKEQGFVSLKIYNLNGREVVTLLNQYLTAGEHLVQWNGQDKSGHSVASGIYFYRLQVDDFESIRKMVYIR